MTFTFLMAAGVLLAMVMGACILLSLAARRLTPDRATLADRIDEILPQTQCGRCDYPGCRPYAEAIARGEADINQCPPGGQEGVDALAGLLGRESKPLNPDHGEELEPMVARVDEARCIGCTRCIQACPVDAIVGAPKLMHVVIESECTGCELCLPPCPVDCIDLVAAPKPDPVELLLQERWLQSDSRPFRPIPVGPVKRSGPYRMREHGRG